MLFTEVNLLAVVAGAVITSALGGFWYSPLLFGKTWLRLMGVTAEQLHAEARGRDDRFLYLFAFAGYLIVAYILALTVEGFFDTPTVGAGILTGALMWLGFVVPTTFYYTSFRGPSKGIWALFVGYQFFAFVIMGALFAIWR